MLHMFFVKVAQLQPASLTIKMDPSSRRHDFGALSHELRTDLSRRLMSGGGHGLLRNCLIFSGFSARLGNDLSVNLTPPQKVLLILSTIHFFKALEEMQRKEQSLQEIFHLPLRRAMKT